MSKLREELSAGGLRWAEAVPLFYGVQNQNFGLVEAYTVEEFAKDKIKGRLTGNLFPVDLPFIKSLSTN